MKKLMIAVAIVCVAVFSQAAQIKWNTKYEICDGTDSETSFTKASTVYLIDAATLTQSDIYDAVTGGKTLAEAVSGKTLKELPLTDGALSAATTFDLAASYAAGSDLTAYMVIFDDTVGGGSLYFSEEITKQLQVASAAVYNFESGTSLDAPMADMKNFSAADGGWVQASAVPEPTSGLLLLLGVAGLALRRRRA